MSENALDRLSKIQTDSNEDNSSLMEEELRDSISSTEFLDGMSDLAKKNLSSIFEEVTLQDEENDMIMPSDVVSSQEPVNTNDFVQPPIVEQKAEIKPEEPIFKPQPKMDELEKEMEDEVTKLANTLAEKDDSDDFIASDPPKFSNITSTNIEDSEDDISDKREVRELKRQLKESDKENQQLKKTQKLMSNEVTNLKKENEKLSSKVNKLTEENNDLKAKLSRKQAKAQEPRESLFKYNTGSTVESSSNPIYDQLVNKILNNLINIDYRLDDYNDDAMKLLFSYMQSKF